MSVSVRPIKTKPDLKAALKEIDRLWDSTPGTSDGDKLDVLATLVEAYEDQHEPILPPHPIDALLYWIESRGLTEHALEELIGNRCRVKDVLEKRRPLTLAMIRRLSSKLGIPAEILIVPYELEKEAA